MSSALAKQLRDLRVRVGDPSFRELSRLSKNTGNGRRLGASTIQEKLNEKSKIKLEQLLRIVELLSTYGELNGTPLTHKETDSNTWRARYVAASAQTIRASTAIDADPSPKKHWDTQPLRLAGMMDLVDLIEQSRDAPVASWVGHVASEMFHSLMSIQGLMEWTAEGSPQEVLQCLQALNEIFPKPVPNDQDPWSSYSAGNEQSCQSLLRFTARKQGVLSTPTIVVGLRRSGLDVYAADYLSQIARWHPAISIRQVAINLRSAELHKDAERMLIAVGEDRVDDRVLEVLRHFDKFSEEKDRDFILRGMARSGVDRFMIAIHGASRDEWYAALISAVPWSKHSEYAQVLRADGLEQLAAQLDRKYEEPPF